MRGRRLLAGLTVLSFIGSLAVSRAAETYKEGRFSANVLAGHTIAFKVDGGGRLSLNLKADGTSMVTMPDTPTFKAYWWVNPMGKLCLVAKPAWNGGKCYTGLVNDQGYLSAVTEPGLSSPLRIVGG